MPNETKSAIDEPGTLCPSCGTRIERLAPGGFGCMVCCLSAGLREEVDDFVSSPGQVPDSLGAYVIVRREDGEPWELGRGAMGVTYRAQDLSLQRQVALKVIKADFPGRGSESRERFMREARAAAALRHPHVATAYQFGVDEESGQSFYAMELVEGETLEERVRRTGPLDLRTVVEIARQITAALAAAEKCGLVHRDLKPANVMIATTEDESEIAIKVIDFGLAKALAEAPDARALTHGGFVGTPAFASPEQLGSAQVDLRSDIYSLGATLCYLLTGRLRFGERAGEPPAPIAQLRAARVPARFISLLVSMLALEPAARPPVKELEKRLEEFRRRISRSSRGVWVTAAVLGVLAGTGILLSRHLGKETSAKAIAVLPFTNLSSEKDDAFFTDGIHDDLLVNLSRIADLKVISRDTLLAYKGGPHNVREIGKALGVQTLLEGNVRHQGNRAIIHVELIDTMTAQQLWAENYDREMTDAFAIQSDLAFQIASILKAKLTAAETRRLKQPATQNGEAYLLYIQANDLFNDYDKRRANLEKAEQFYERAIQLDPNFTLAIAQLSQMETLFHEMYDPRPARLARARVLAERAAQLQPDLPEAHMAMGRYFGHGDAGRADRDYARALKEWEMAQRGLPNNTETYIAIAKIERHLGKWEESLKNLKTVAGLDPTSPEVWHRLCGTYEMMRDFPKATEALERAMALSPNSWNFEAHYAWLEAWSKGDLRRLAHLRAPVGSKPEDLCVADRVDAKIFLRKFGEAEKILLHDPRTEIDRVPRDLWLGRVYFREGGLTKGRASFAAARTLLEEKVRTNPADTFARSLLAESYAGLGLKSEAIREKMQVVEAIPEAKDAWFGPLAQQELALIYAMLGEPRKAVPILAHLLTEVDFLNVQDLRLNPCWDPLRSDPQFQKLLRQPDHVFAVAQR